VVSMKVLLTGFDIFKKEKKNPSWEAIKDMEDIYFEGTEIVKRKLPVEFKKAIEIVSDLLLGTKPDFYIAFGLAGGRTTITVERVAINIMDSKAPDNSGYTPDDEPIFEDGPTAYFSTVPIKKIITNLHNEGIPALISNSAGTYVCNTVFYTGLYISEKYELPTRVGFVHLPYQSDQVLDKNVPSYPIEFIKKAIKVVIKSLISEYNEQNQQK